MLFGESEWGGACKRLAAAAKLQDSHQDRERPSMCLCMWSEHIKYSFSLIQQKQQRERDVTRNKDTTNQCQTCLQMEAAQIKCLWW